MSFKQFKNINLVPSLALGSALSLALSFVLLSTSSMADWTLNNNASSLYYISSKAAAVSEVNTFSELSGSIDNDGKAQLSIDLSSVDTAVDIRNQRVRDILFEIANFPSANISLNVNVDALDSMPAGMSVSGNYAVSLELHGVTEQIDAVLQVTKLVNDNIQVQLVKPLIISAASFGLDAGVEELREIAGLGSINNNVTIDFTLLFGK